MVVQLCSGFCIYIYPCVYVESFFPNAKLVGMERSAIRESRGHHYLLEHGWKTIHVYRWLHAARVAPQAQESQGILRLSTQELLSTHVHKGNSLSNIQDKLVNSYTELNVSHRPL